jgi:hypothetical protein
MLLPISLLCACVDSGKTTGSDAKGGVRGRLFTEDGKPAAFAHVRILPVDFKPGPAFRKAGAADKAYLSTTTDADGNYAFDTLAAGDYNILGDKGELLSYQDSVGISGNSDIPPDTLKSSGTLTGTVAVQSNPDPGAVTVEVLGTNIYVNVDRHGGFSLPPMAQGAYTVRLATDMAEYTTLFAQMKVRSGRQDTLAEPFRLRYSGIPVATGLRVAAYDSLNGKVTLTWNKPDYDQLLGFTIFRDTLDAVTLSQNPINKSRITDTVFTDSIFTGPADPTTVTRRYEYRVKIQRKDGVLGSAYETVRFDAKPPSQIGVKLSLRALGVKQDTLAAGDTVRFIAEFQKPSRSNTTVEWYRDSSTQATRTLTLDSKSGVDTLAFYRPSPGTYQIRLVIKDEAGLRWRDSTNLVVPSIVRLPDLPMAVEYPLVTTLDGKIYLFSNGNLWEYDPGPATWRKRASSPRPGSATIPSWTVPISSSIVASGSRLYIIGFESINPPLLTGSVQEYQPTTDAWVEKSGLPGNPRSAPSLIYRNGKILVYGGAIRDYPAPSAFSDEVFEFDPDADAWASKPAYPDPYHGVLGTLLPSGSSLFEVIHNATQAKPTLAIRKYDPENNTLTNGPALDISNVFPTYAATTIGLGSVNGKIYALGGDDGYMFGGSAFSNKILEYDPATDSWSEKGRLSSPRSRSGVVGLNGSLYILGGRNGEKIFERYTF